jgi:hypothetical protein
MLRPIGFWDLIRFWDEKREKRTDVRVRVHAAWLNDPARSLCYFVNVYNASPEREVTVTHVWFETTPPVHFVNPGRPLPIRIAPRDQWETWLEVDRVPATPPDVYELARARLADDRTITSIERRDLPSAGAVPGA